MDVSYLSYGFIGEENNFSLFLYSFEEKKTLKYISDNPQSTYVD